MSRALRLVVTQKEVSAFLKLSKNTAECAQWYSVQKQYGVRSGVEKSMSYGHVEMKDAANMNSFRLMRMQKSSGAKCSLSAWTVQKLVRKIRIEGQKNEWPKINTA